MKLKLNKNKKTKYYIAAILASICLGTIWILIKKIWPNVPIMTISFLRVSIAFFVITPVLFFFDRKAFSPTKWDLKQYIIIGVLMAISTALFNLAMSKAPVQNVTILNNIYPFFVMLFARYLLKERITKTHIIASLIAIAWLIIANPWSSGQYLHWNLLAILAGITAALFLTKMRQIDKTHSIWSLAWVLLFASLSLSFAPIVYGFWNIFAVWEFILILWVFSTGLTYLLLNFAFEKIDADSGSLVTMIAVPVFSILFAVIFLKEQLNIQIILGGSVILISWIYLKLKLKK